MVWVYEVLVIIAMASCSLYMYWKTRLKEWLLLGLGLFLLTSNVISVAIIELVSIFVFPPYRFIDLALNLELVVSSSMIAVGLSLILRLPLNGHW